MNRIKTKRLESIKIIRKRVKTKNLNNNKKKRKHYKANSKEVVCALQALKSGETYRSVSKE